MVHGNSSPPGDSSTEDLLHDNEGNSCNESGGSADSPALSRSSSFVSSSSWLSEDWDFTPLDRLTMFDVLDNLALPQRLEKINKTLNLKKHRDKVKEQYVKQKQRVIMKRDQELDKLKAKYTKGLDELIVRWNDTRVGFGSYVGKAVMLTSFIGSLSPGKDIICCWRFEYLHYRIFGRRIPVSLCLHSFCQKLTFEFRDWMHVWYSLQLVYFMPLRYYTYHKMGYHYFLADLVR